MAVEQRRKLMDVQEVRRAYALLTEPGQVVELRALKASREGNSRYTSTISGYFDNVDRLIQHVQQIRIAKGIYITLQACNPDLLDRAENKLIQADRDATTSDKHITRYRWLLIDSDPGGDDKISNISSTNAEHAQALAHSQQIADALSEQGWPAPIQADSGNGAHLLYKIDLPASESELIKRVLEGLAAKHNTPDIRIDQTVYNPARICKLYGTLACKGDDTTRRPHRLSHLLSIPDDIQIVTREQLEAAAAPARQREPARELPRGEREPFTAEAFLQKHHIPVRSSDPYLGGTRYHLNACAWDSDHTDSSACVYQLADGHLGASCSHNSCRGKGWHEFRLRFEPDAYSGQVKATTKKAEKQVSEPDTETPMAFCPIPAVDLALRTKNVFAIYSNAAEIAQLDDISLKHLRVNIKRIWSRDFPMREFDDLLQAERRKAEQNKRRNPVIGSARALMKKQFAPVDWIVPGILPPGLIVLAGKQKIGKSWFDYNLGLSVASGSVALGHVQVGKGDVLYLALEDNEQRLQDRFKVLLGPDEEIPEGLDYATEWPRMDETGLAALEAWIVAHPKARLIIIDPWVKVKPRLKARAGETGYDADYEALEGLKRLSDTYKLCILVQFHLRKAGAEDPFDELNGTSGITACADGFLSLKRGRNEADATLWGTGRDYKVDVDLALSFNSGFWNVIGNAEEYALSKESKEILDVLAATGKPMRPKDIAEALDKPAGTVRKMLFGMKKREEIKETDAGYLAQSGNGGNAGNSGNGGNAVTPTPHQAQNVTALPHRYQDGHRAVTLTEPLAEPVGAYSVTGVTTVTTFLSQNDHFTEATNDDDEESQSGKIIVMPQKDVHIIARCETRFDSQMSEAHEPGQILATDAVGNNWCEQCEAQHKLMDLGHAKGWPAAILELHGGKVKLGAGQDRYLKFARVSGHRLVSAAAARLETMKDTK
jgi:hypothetical protein